MYDILVVIGWIALGGVIGGILGIVGFYGWLMWTIMKDEDSNNINSH